MSEVVDGWFVIVYFDLVSIEWFEWGDFVSECVVKLNIYFVIYFLLLVVFSLMSFQ